VEEVEFCGLSCVFVHEQDPGAQSFNATTLRSHRKQTTPREVNNKDFRDHLMSGSPMPRASHYHFWKCAYLTQQYSLDVQWRDLPKSLKHARERPPPTECARWVLNLYHAIRGMMTYVARCWPRGTPAWPALQATNQDGITPLYCGLIKLELVKAPY
jgi:hypothetical protein